MDAYWMVFSFHQDVRTPVAFAARRAFRARAFPELNLGFSPGAQRRYFRSLANLVSFHARYRKRANDGSVG